MQVNYSLCSIWNGLNTSTSGNKHFNLRAASRAGKDPAQAQLQAHTEAHHKGCLHGQDI